MHTDGQTWDGLINDFAGCPDLDIRKTGLLEEPETFLRNEHGVGSTIRTDSEYLSAVPLVPVNGNPLVPEGVSHVPADIAATLELHSAGTHVQVDHW